MALALSAAGCGMSTRQEVELGRQSAAEIDRKLPLVRDPQVLAYLAGLGGTMTNVADTRRLRWSFRLVDAPAVNAFALPGGYVYVNRGLVERARTLSELAGVLGHEIAHVTERHSVRQIEKARGVKAGLIAFCTLVRVCDSGVGHAAISTVGAVTFAKFSRDDESAADREGIRYVIRAGIDPNGVPEMFEMLLHERKSRPEGLETYFLSHPLEEERVEAARAIIATYDPAVLRGLKVDDAAFERFKHRVQALPPSPVPVKPR